MADYIVHKAVELSALSAKVKASLADVRSWIISPKYDGCHAIFAYDEGKCVGVYSRTGETVSSMPHIARSLPDIYDLSKGRIAVCGEAWIVGEEFNVVSGAFRRHAPQPQLQFVPFDVVPFDYNTDSAAGPVIHLGQYEGRAYPAPYANRVGVFANRKDVPSQVLRPRYVVFTGTPQEAVLAANAYATEHKARTDSFFDGAILAPASGTYQVGAGKGGEFIKIKPLLSETVVVTAVISDLGTKTGKNTCVLCFDLDGQVQKVSTGLTQAQADEYTAYPENIIGKHIEVEAMGRTANDLLREPRFKGIRSDV